MSEPEFPMSDPRDFISRDLSWIDFNSRVLDEAASPANPLLEKLKFIAIVSSNLDEFFMVRIAGLRQQHFSGSGRPDPAGNLPGRQLQLARAKIARLVTRQYHLLLREILPALEKEGIFLRQIGELSAERRERLHRYFSSEILPVLTPLAVDPAHPFPLLNSGAVEIAVSLTKKEGGNLLHAFVEVPEVLPRFLSADGGNTELSSPPRRRQEFLLLEELIFAWIEELFPGCTVQEKRIFRITRDMDFSVESEEMNDLLQTIRGKLLQRRQRDPVRLEIQGGYRRSELLDYLISALALEEDSCYFLPGPLHLKQLFSLLSLLDRPDLLEEPWPSVLPAPFVMHRSVTDAIREAGTILLAPPYHSFSPIVDLLEQSAGDPQVLAIKQTLYRVSGNSPVVRALRRAAENGKQVTVVLELKARFDESNNIAWAELLDRSGAHVVYGIAGLKVHSKALMIVRKEEGGIRRYVHLGTGNYNDRTAQTYTDMGIFSCDPELCFDVANLFNLLSGCSAPPEQWNCLAVAPFDLRERLEMLIEREIAHVRQGRPGRIIAKMNSFSDERMVSLIHRAADEGVEIDLIVRGICCYRPLPKQENIRIISIVDRFLEHTRIFCFGNGGETEYYLSSADWMTRNLDRRIETMFPVRDEAICKELRQVLEFQLQDTDKARRLLPTGVYTRPKTPCFTSARSQARTWAFFRKKASDALRGAGGETLKVFTSK